MATYTQIVAPRKGTSDGPGWCLRYAQSFFGAPVRYNSAWDAWNATQYRHSPSEPLPDGVAVLLWFKHFGSYGSPPTYGNWGHVAIHVSGDAIYTSPITGSAWGFQRYANIAQMAAIMNLEYVGWSEDINGLRVVQPSAPAPLGPKQRKTGSNPVKRRADATTKSAEKSPVLAANTVGDFVAWKRGERVNDGVRDTDIWFQGNSGDWFWSGGFTSQSTDNLVDKTVVVPPTPTPTNPGQRKVDPTPVNVRSAARAGASLVSTLPANSLHTPEGWVTGDTVDNIAIWYKLPNGYAWAGGFTQEDTSGLKDLNAVKPTPVPEPTPDPKPETTPDQVRKPVSVTTPNWDKVAPDGSEVFTTYPTTGKDIAFPATVVESVSPVDASGYNIGREGPVNHVVLHHGDTTSLSGILKTLDGVTGSPTSQYAVKDSQAVAMVSEVNTAWTNTRWMSNSRSVTVEICNDVVKGDKPSAASHETAAWITARAAVRHGMELPLAHGINVFGHKEVSKLPTACPGLLDIGWIVKRANEIIASSDIVVGPVGPGSSEIAARLAIIERTTADTNRLLREIFNTN